MSEQEMQNALKLLGYSPEWLTSGFLDVAMLESQIAYYDTGKDQNREHYRYAAFRHVLSSRSTFTETEIIRYIKLAEQDEDWGMARSALCDLIQWQGLSQEQFDRLSGEPRFSESLFQKLIRRRRLLTQLETLPLSEGIFVACLDSQDFVIQRELVMRSNLTQEQLEILREQGANGAIRNLAKDKLRHVLKASWS